MPATAAPISHAHRLMRRHAWLGPDAKSQVTCRYAAGRPVAVTAVVLSTMHPADLSTAALRAT